MADIPDLDAVRAYVRVPASSLSDEDLERMRAACLLDQAARCTWPGLDLDPPDPDSGYNDALAQGLLRRVQREIAARNLPLGMVGLEAEYGPANIPGYDALTEHHEHAYRRVVLA
jgi:hypothetical protein